MNENPLTIEPPSQVASSQAEPAQPESPLTDDKEQARAARKKNRQTRRRFSIYMIISYFSMQGTIYLCHEKLKLGVNLSGAIAIVLVSFVNFYWLMCFVYQTADGHRGQQFWKYTKSIVGFRIWEFIVLYLLFNVCGMFWFAASTIMQAQSIVMKFFVYKKMVFKKEPHPSEEELAVHASPPNLSDD